MQGGAAILSLLKGQPNNYFSCFNAMRGAAILSLLKGQPNNNFLLVVQ
jgi:hypothetical protein